MLRSLDPKKNFESPKSKAPLPTESEKKKFSAGELDYIDDSEKRAESLTLTRAMAAHQAAAARKALGLEAAK